MKNVQNGAVEECMGLIDFGIKQLEFLLAVRSENYLLGSKSGNVRNGLDAVISYQQKCLEQLPSKQFR
ncbi:hypothetical protein FF1_033220 [Malus domestica]